MWHPASSALDAQNTTHAWLQRLRNPFTGKCIECVLRPFGGTIGMPHLDSSLEKTKTTNSNKPLGIAFSSLGIPGIAVFGSCLNQNPLWETRKLAHLVHVAGE